MKPGIPKLPDLPLGWIYAAFADLVDVVKRPAALDDETVYQLVTAKRSRGGIVPRERLTGQQIKTKTQFYCSQGDFLISRRQISGMGHALSGPIPAATLSSSDRLASMMQPSITARERHGLSARGSGKPGPV